VSFQESEVLNILSFIRRETKKEKFEYPIMNKEYPIPIGNDEDIYNLDIGNSLLDIECSDL